MRWIVRGPLEEMGCLDTDEAEDGVLANELEDRLVKLLVQVVPPEHRDKVDVTRWMAPRSSSKAARTSSPTRPKSTTYWRAWAFEPTNWRSKRQLLRQRRWARLPRMGQHFA